MDRKTTGIILTVATSLLVGCPGLMACCLSPLVLLLASDSQYVYETTGSSDATGLYVLAGGALCLGVILVAVPVLVGIFSLRSKPVPASDFNEPIPPPL